MNKAGALDPLETIKFGSYYKMKDKFREPDFDERKILKWSFDNENHADSPP